MKKPLLTLLYFFLLLWNCFSSETFAQSRSIDSIQQALKDFDGRKLELHKNLLPDESDTAKVAILNDLSWQLALVYDYVSAKKNAEDALGIAQQIGFKKGMGNAYTNLGAIYWYQGNYPEALKNHFAALKIKEEAGNKQGISNSYNNIGLIYWQQGNYPEALKNYFASLKIDEELGNKDGIASSYNNIGVIYQFQGNYSEALKNYFAALKVFEEIGNKKYTANNYGNIGNIYYSQGNYPEALKNYYTALKIAEEIGSKDVIADSYGNIGNIYSHQGNYPEALKNYFTTLKINEEIGDKESIATSFINIGNTRLKMQAAREGKEWLLKGLQLSKEMEAIPVMKDSYEGLAAVDSALGNFKGAFENYKLFVMYRDSVNNEDATKKSLQTKMQYEFDKKEAENKAVTDAELNKQKLVRNGFIGGIALLFIIVLLIYRNYRKQRLLNKELAETQEQLVRSEKMAAFGVMASRVAHEIQNPLNFVNNFSELSEELVQEIVSNENKNERQEAATILIVNMQKIHLHGQRATAIVRDLEEHTRAGTAHKFFEDDKNPGND